MLLKYAPFIKLFNLLKQVNYGITIDGKNINPFAVEDENFFADHYHYLSPEEFITNKCGVCWDYVSFQTWYLKNKLSRYPYKNYYVEWSNPERATHTFTVINLGDEYVYFEVSFYDIRGIYTSNNLEDIFTFVLAKTIANVELPKCHYVIREFMEYTNYGCDFLTYMNDMNKFPIVKTGVFTTRNTYQPLKKIY